LASTFINRDPAREWWRPELAPNQVHPPDVAAANGDTVSAPGSLAFWASVAFTLVLFLAPQQVFPVFATLRIALLTSGVALVAFLTDRFLREQPLSVITRETRLAGALAGWAILTVPVSFSPGGSVSLLVNLYLKSLALFWLLSNTVNTPVRHRRLAWTISLMALPLAGSALSNFLSASFTPAVVRAPRRIVGYHSPLMSNPNDMALMLNVVIPLTVALLLTVHRPGLRMLLAALVLFDVLGVIVTFSRGGFMTLATITGAYLWKLRTRPQRAWAWGTLVLALACLPFLPSGYLARLATITDIESDVTTSAQMRSSDMVSAARFVLANPILGSGIGAGTIALQHETGWRAIHNVYLEYAVELGLPGLVLFVLLLTGCVRSVGVVQRQAAASKSFHDISCLAEGLQISLLAFSVAAFFHPLAYNVHFYYIAGLAVALKRVWIEQPRTTA
jgi:O-antigen ligase